MAQYSILIEEQPLGEFDQIRLTDSLTGKSLGEFSVIQVEPLEAVCELRIWSNGDCGSMSGDNFPSE